MPLGDSITYDCRESDIENPRPSSLRTGYRSHLWYMLKDANFSANFVGSRTAGQSIKPPFDPNNEGHPNWTSFDIAEKIYTFMQMNTPDIILLHIGTNDFSHSVNGVRSILDEVDRYEKNTGKTIRVLVALIIDRKSHDLNIAGFNSNLANLFQKRWENGDILTLVNMQKDAKLTKSDYADKTHPNNNGYRKMAKVWFDAITSKYEKYTSAPITKDDNVTVETGSKVFIDVIANDTDRQNDMNGSTVSLLGGIDTDNDGDKDELNIEGQGIWKVNEFGIVTFEPVENFTSDPSSIQYTVKDLEGESSEPAKININYRNSSLESFPASLVNESLIEYTLIDESTSTISFVTNIPENGITF